ncbi:uncharacterized protein N0V89_001579 [Didymosphaeria variabile]|uniref:Uncharacterized protein n=1 Tax=Didymosphaeria variabile TaxID=1932322 RepID=A0A9W9CGV8_9PLEO|nr:uncharacterized protein N0V89_001579 [Didymosphaeria variabile]KAJ4361010.1 hypothetical protein N0V89_001579 [Didymosphaeria variabile]
MEQIAEKHKGLIGGMSKIYDILIAMRYLSASDVIRPPIDNQSLPFSQLRSLGYESEVLGLVQQLPALRSEVVWGFQEWGVELLPRSKVVTYFSHPDDPDFLNDLLWGDFYKTDDPNEMKWLHPWMLKLTECGQNGYGTSLIYNIRDQSIIEWTQIGRKYWDDMPSRPAEEVLSEIAEKLESLEWVPYYDSDDKAEAPLFQRKLVEDPIVFQNIWSGGIRVPGEIAAAIEYLQSEHGDADWLRQSINRWRALQMHYVDSRWATGAWDADAFWEKRVAWIRELHALERQRPHGAWSDNQKYLEHPMLPDWENRHFDFFKQSAGDRAV